MKLTTRIRMNLAAVNVSFLFNCGAFYGTMGLQSSLNKTLGTQSLSALYASMMFSALLLPPLVIGSIGERKSMALGTLAYPVYTITNLYARPYTLIPGAIVLGCGGAILAASVRGYVRTMSVKYSAINGSDNETTTTHFFGIFMAFLSASLLFGNVISSLILQTLSETSTDNSIPTNTTAYTNSYTAGLTAETQITTIVEMRCGIHNCDGGYAGAQTAAVPTENVRVNTLMLNILFGVFALMQVLGALIVIALVKDIEGKKCASVEMALTGKANAKKTQSRIQIISTRIVATAKLNFFDSGARLLIPITLGIGILEGFVMGQLTRDWMTCYMGIEYVGYAVSIFGIGSIASSYGSGLLSHVVSRRTMLLTNLMLEIAAGSALLLWEPNMPSDTWMLYVTFGAYGIIYTTRKTLINSGYSILFPAKNEAANASSTLWLATGAATAFALSSRLCNRTYIILTLALSLAGTMMYVMAERILNERYKNRSAAEKIHPGNQAG